jgi:hypothetical protein
VRHHAPSTQRGPSRNRLAGYICHVGQSRSAVFWAILKDENGIEHFAYGPNFLTFPAVPRIGQQVTFVPCHRYPVRSFHARSK